MNPKPSTDRKFKGDALDDRACEIATYAEPAGTPRRWTDQDLYDAYAEPKVKITEALQARHDASAAPLNLAPDPFDDPVSSTPEPPAGTPPDHGVQVHDSACEIGQTGVCNCGVDHRSVAPSSPAAPALCGEIVTHLIAGASWYPCALLKGHDGGHRAAGKCIAHGDYLGEVGAPPCCPKWPDCVKDGIAKMYPAAPAGEREQFEAKIEELVADWAAAFTMGTRHNANKLRRVLREFAAWQAARASASTQPTGTRSCLICGYAPDAEKDKHMPGVWDEVSKVHVCIECRQRSQTVMTFGLTIDELRKAAAMYRAVPSPAEPPSWIPVSERVPEVGVPVLCTRLDHADYWIDYLDNFHDGLEWASDQSSLIPTHWQPLPAPPRRGDDAEETK